MCGGSHLSVFSNACTKGAFKVAAPDNQRGATYIVIWIQLMAVKASMTGRA
jgi:hypothetical protein